MEPDRADLNREAICGASDQFVFKKTDSKLASGSDPACRSRQASGGNQLQCDGQTAAAAPHWTTARCPARSRRPARRARCPVGPIPPLFVLKISGVGILDFTMAHALPTLLRTKEASGDRHRECATIRQPARSPGCCQAWTTSTPSKRAAST